MYNSQFSNIDELMQVVHEDKNAEGVRATTQ